MILTNRRYIKSPGNTTTTSLKKYSSVEEHNVTVRTSSFVEGKRTNTGDDNGGKPFDEDSASIRQVSK